MRSLFFNVSVWLQSRPSDVLIKSRLENIQYGTIFPLFSVRITLLHFGLAFEGKSITTKWDLSTSTREEGCISAGGFMFQGEALAFPFRRVLIFWWSTLPTWKKIYTEPKALALMRKAFGYFMDHAKRLLGLGMEITILMRNIFLYKLLRLIFLIFIVWFWLWISCLLDSFGDLLFSTKSN